MSVRPAWEVREGEDAIAWFNVRLAFADGAWVDVLAVVCGGRVLIEDVRAEPALSFGDLTILADWIGAPVFVACGLQEPAGEADGETDGLADGGTTDEAFEGQGPDGGTQGARRVHPAWPRGVEGRRLVAQEYRAAQEKGVDPVLAVMRATGHSRRRALRLIAQARDAGFLTPRHVRR